MTTSFWGSTSGFLDEPDEEAEGLEGEGQGGFLAGRDGLIFLVDCTESMFLKSSEGEIPFDICIQCARNVLMTKALSNDKDLVAVIFYGTEKKQNPNDFKNVYILQDLDTPDANRILQLDKLIEDDMVKTFSKNYGHSNDFSFADALWACSNMFANSQTKLGSKSVMLFTNSDDPHEHSSELKKRAIRKAKDITDLGITIQLLHMKQPGKSFDFNKFYQDVLDEEDVNATEDPSDKFDELLNRVERKHKQRAITRIPLRLSDGLKLGVSIYTSCRPAAKGAYVQVDSKTNEEVKCVTKYICNDTGQELMPTDIKYYQTFGGAKVIFEKNEVESIRSFGETGLQLMGFKSRSSLKAHYHVKPGQFIYPDESTVSGSTTLFSALLKRCLSKDVVAICLYIPRSNATPRLVTLLPQEEELDDHNIQVKPPGFHLKFLPFSDDIRKLKIEETPKANEEQIDKAKKMIDKLKFKFSTNNFENPVLQKFYRTIEALALDKDEVEEVPDTTLPRLDMMEKRGGKEIEEFQSVIFPDDYDPTKAGGKRKATGATGAAAKKPKIEVDINMKEEAQKGKLTKLTVPILKQFCQTNKIKSSSQKKADLIDAINEHFDI